STRYCPVPMPASCVLSKIWGCCWITLSIASSTARSSLGETFSHSARRSPGPSGQLAAFGLPPPVGALGVGTGVTVMGGVEPDEGVPPPPHETPNGPTSATSTATRANFEDKRTAIPTSRLQPTRALRLSRGRRLRATAPPMPIQPKPKFYRPQERGSTS